MERINLKNIFAHEVELGDQITYNEIYPKTIFVTTRESKNNGNSQLINDKWFPMYATIKKVN